jgi:hypothetical protein
MCLPDICVKVSPCHTLCICLRAMSMQCAHVCMRVCMRVCVRAFMYVMVLRVRV